MKALSLIFLGVWMVGTLLMIVELAVERIREATRTEPAVCPYHRMETVTETALRAMLTEALNTRMSLQRRA